MDSEKSDCSDDHDYYYDNMKDRFGTQYQGSMLGKGTIISTTDVDQ